MQWLSQNWIWIILAIGAFYLLFRRGHHGMGGFGHGGGHDSGNYGGHSHGGGRGSGGPMDNEATAIDPVSGKEVRTAHATTTYYQGRIFFFETPENRQRFEEAPEKYAHGAAGMPAASSEHRHRRHGC